MHPYLPHLLMDIENAKRSGYSDNRPLFSNYEPEEDVQGYYEEDDTPWPEMEEDEMPPFASNPFPFLPKDTNDITKITDEPDMADKGGDDDTEELFAEVESFVRGEAEPKTFGDHCGLKVADFPPAEQLSEEDMKTIIRAYGKMGVTWNIDFCFPKELPATLHYNILINTLNERIMIMKNGFYGMDYCSGNPDGCIFGEYCGCLKYWNE